MQTTTTLLAETDNGKIFKIFVTPQNDSETQSLATNSPNDVNIILRDNYISLQIDALKTIGKPNIIGNLTDNSGVIVINN